MSLFEQLINIIYPPRCAICREFLIKSPLKDPAPALPFCHACFSDFKPIMPPLCPICGAPFASTTQENHPCGACLTKRPFFDAAAAPYTYGGPLLQAVYGLKYRGKTYLAKALGSLLATFAEKWIPRASAQLVIPVPLHPKRLRERGFNQSLLLARPVAAVLSAELDVLSLKRVRPTLPQTGLAKKERHKNIRRAFQLEDNAVVKNQSVLLVDDVATTMSTLNECARVLKRAGAMKIYCLTLARATTL